VTIFSPEQRERLRDELVAAAESDANLSGAAHTGSAASSRLDRWSDIDLALCLRPTAAYDLVVAEWTERLYQHHEAVAHVDVMRGATLFRVFLLKNTLQVDLAFWKAEEFGPIGPNFKLIFGAAKPAVSSPAPQPNALIGMAWLYALHVRSSLCRDRTLQAEYMLSGMRNHVFELTCLRCGVTPYQGRGLDDLPACEKETASACIPRSLGSCQLKRAFQATMQVLLKEVRMLDAKLETELSGPLNALVL